jgi:E3 ubiquitin-protein ligase TRIP12
MLVYLDFFPNGVQRVAVSAAANLCRSVSEEHFAAVLAVTPNLINFLQHHDRKGKSLFFLLIYRIGPDRF